MDHSYHRIYKECACSLEGREVFCSPGSGSPSREMHSCVCVHVPVYVCLYWGGWRQGTIQDCRHDFDLDSLTFVLKAME